MLKNWFLFVNSNFFRIFAPSKQQLITDLDYGKDNYNKRKTSL